MKLSPAFWSILAVAATAATLCEGAYLFLWQPAPVPVQAAFVLCGLIAACCS